MQLITKLLRRAFNLTAQVTPQYRRTRKGPFTKRNPSVTVQLQELLGRELCTNSSSCRDDRCAGFKVCPQQPVGPSHSIVIASLPAAIYCLTEGISVCQGAV